jgi:hypothetical protein
MMDELLEGESEETVEPQKQAPTATLDQLKKKKRVTKTATVVLNDDAGEPVEVSLTFQGIPAFQYDRLISKHPPRPKDKKQGYGYNPDAFGPAIVAATCIDPPMSEEDAKEIWESEDWNRGELMILLMSAIEVCTTGLNIPFKRPDSG